VGNDLVEPANPYHNTYSRFRICQYQSGERADTTQPTSFVLLQANQLAQTSSTNDTPDPGPSHTFILLGALLIVHAPLVVDMGLFGDDWLLFKLKPGYPVNTGFLIHGAGHPFLYAYCTLANWLGFPLLFMNLLALAGIGIGAVSLKNFLLRLRIFSEFESATFAFIVWSYAGYQNWASKLTATYIFSFALLCLGLNLFSIIAGSKQLRTGLRTCALVAIFCSFSLNSMIAAYYVGLFAMFLVETLHERNSGTGISSRLIKWAKHFGDFLIVPFVYWFSTHYFFPKIGPYSDYYHLTIPSWRDLMSGSSNFWTWGFFWPLHMAGALVKGSRLPTIAALLVGLGFTALVARKDKSNAGNIRLLSAAWPIGAAALTFVACASPYIVSGLSPTGHFYESRHLILFGIPLGLILICAYRSVRKISNSRIAGLLLVALVLSVNLCALWSSYFYQQARWLRQEAMVEGLRHAYREPPAAVFDLVDGFLDYPLHAYFGTTEITGMLHLAWDSRPLFGFTGRNERPTILQETDKSLHMNGTALRNIDLWGPQATITLTPREPVLTNYQLSRSYYLCLITSCEQLVIDSLADVAIRIGPIPNLAPPQS
jgi:hypothetical protein